MESQDESIQRLKQQHDHLQEGLSPNVMAIRDGIFVPIEEGAYDSYPKFGFQFFCFRSPDMVREMDVFIKYAKDKRFLIDCGAYHGIFSFVFRSINPEGYALAFEPFDEPFKVVERLIRFVSNVLISKTALSNRNGTLQMSEYGGHLQQDDNGSYSVPCIQGDEIVNDATFPPDFIKIDVEGQELEVLEGFYGTLKFNHPTVLLELHLNQLPKEKVEKMFKIINDCNYKVLNIEDEQEITLEQILTKTGEVRVILV